MLVKIALFAISAANFIEQSELGKRSNVFSDPTYLIFNDERILKEQKKSNSLFLELIKLNKKGANYKHLLSNILIISISNCLKKIIEIIKSGATLDHFQHKNGAIMDKTNKQGDEEKTSKKAPHFLWQRRLEFLTGALMLIGVILAFFYTQTGGGLIGLAFGLYFYNEIFAAFFQLKGFYLEQGIFKSLMWLGTILYFLITIPAFIIGCAIGFGVIFFIRRSLKK